MGNKDRREGCFSERVLAEMDEGGQVCSVLLD